MIEQAENVGVLGRVEERRHGLTLEWLREHAWIGVWWAGTRAFVFAIAFAVHVLGRPAGYLRHDVHAHVFGLLNAWDGRWYRLVAAEGYLLVPGRQSDPAFFPLYPLLLRLGEHLGVSAAASGLILSNLLLLVALVAFHALTRDVLGRETARRATIYVAVFPLGFVFSMAYPESLVLAALALAALAALRNRWAAAALCAAAAALARPEGLFVALPLLAVAWRRRRTLDPVDRGLALGAVAAPAAALVSYPLYLAQVLHDPFAWSTAEHAWGRSFSPLGVVKAFETLPAAFHKDAWVLRDATALVLYLVLLVLARRAGTPWAWVGAAFLVFVLPLFSGSFNSLGRFGLLAPPVFWGLAALGRRRTVDLTIRVLSLALLAALTVTLPFVFP